MKKDSVLLSFHNLTETTEKTALVADHTRGLILDAPTDKQLNDRKGILERKLEPKKDSEGKVIEIPEKEKLDMQAELEAINNTIENKPKGEPEQITQPIFLNFLKNS